ncbi:hypothetical protein [Mesorhizobium amorphae]|nr:hypothetical protein [Mesorhizobium amorphae]
MTANVGVLAALWIDVAIGILGVGAFAAIALIQARVRRSVASLQLDPELA